MQETLSPVRPRLRRGISDGPSAAHARAEKSANKAVAAASSRNSRRVTGEPGPGLEAADVNSVTEDSLACPERAESFLSLMFHLSDICRRTARPLASGAGSTLVLLQSCAQTV